MALHGDYVAKINEQKQRLEESNPYEWDEARCLQERLLFCSGLIKCADISNVARPFPRAFEWAQILIEEFASQGDLERELGMNVLPMNDRSKIVLEDSQIGFIKFVALGLFSSVADYMKGKQKLLLAKFVSETNSLFHLVTHRTLFSSGSYKKQLVNMGR